MAVPLRVLIVEESEKAPRPAVVDPGRQNSAVASTTAQPRRARRGQETQYVFPKNPGPGPAWDNALGENAQP